MPPRKLPPPRQLAELPYAEYLIPAPANEAPERDTTHDCIHFENTTFQDTDHGSPRFLECAFSGATFTAGRYRSARFNDVWMDSVRLLSTDLAESDWQDTEMIAGSLAGVEAFSAELRRVTFHNCKFDSVNLRAAKLHDAAFSNCLLRDVDLSGAELHRVTFPGSTLDQVRLEKAQLTEVDLRDTAALAITADHDALRGATISTAQLLDLAPFFAQVLGIEVSDD